MHFTPTSLTEAAKRPDLHERISPPGAQSVSAIAEEFGPLPEDYLRFLQEYGAWHFFKTVGSFSDDDWWFGVGWEPKIARTDNDVWFACGYRFTLGYHYFKYNPKARCFAAAVYGARGSGLGVSAPSFTEWFQQSIAWSYKRLSKKAWREQFGLPKL
jgi:hypothetical protein